MINIVFLFHYFACWSKENTNYYIEEFVKMYKDLLNK